ncbi:multidrug and toxin extrusion protein 1 [Gaeumannomyces tritici R3-111a-1]|uniref:Multidrug and toxin extrusion protein 1 n=1 Tax=Gaeumannomyces tritici (strain R3-111a-1) TaxID=644352 RepID=J3NFS5_GAET3|nr:multidrug and toxin extrusion protein 1 [Gaeumannomyces tritici R3-111a-1]EJT80115.1 multidrug and toxin extrusion protein 1 [Gaeumannomyces tritici R3-111a-1]
MSAAHGGRGRPLDPENEPTETTSLLPKPASVASSTSALSTPDSTSAGTGELPGPSQYPQWLSEIWFLVKASIPVIMAYTLQNSVQTVSVLIVGRLSPEALATAAFSYMFAMSTAWLIALGGATALDTLASSSYTGSASKHDLGILLQRGVVILTAFYVAVACMWWFSEPLFRALGQEEFICVQSSRFLRCMIPGGFGYIWFEAMKKYLQAQEIYQPGTYVLLITSPLSAALNYFFIHNLGLGLYGAPVATGIAYWVSFLLLVLYAAFVRGHECWGGLDLRRALRPAHMAPFAKLALLGIMHVGTEWWAFEIVALAAGRLGTIPLAAQSVIMTADQIINTIPFGLGVATSSHLGNLLGARRAGDAERAAHCAALLSVLNGGAILAALWASKDVFGRLFNDDERVVRLVSEVMPWVALFQIADGLNGSCGGALRGMGRQSVGAAVNMVSYYGGALPMGIYLAFHGWGLGGLWVGQCVALYLVGAFEWLIVGMSKWEREVERARERLESGGLAVAAQLEDEQQWEAGGGGSVTGQDHA